MPVEQIATFRINAEQALLTDLQTRLRRTNRPDEVEAESSRYGPPVAYMQSFVDYWLNEYDWRAQEARLNEMNHFTTHIGEHRIHFIHQRGNGPHRHPSC